MTQLKYYFNAIYLSLYSRRFYADLIANRKDLGFYYLMILSLILSVFLSAQVKALMENIFGHNVDSAQNIENIEKQFPELYIENSQFKFNITQNQQVTSLNGDVIMIFDVENKVNDLDPYQQIIVIDAESMRVKLPDNGGIAVLMASDIGKSFKQYFDVQPLGKLKLNKTKLFNDLEQFSKIPYLLIVMIAALWYLGMYAISVIFMSFITGIFLAIMCRHKVFDFRQSFRIAAYTATPVMLLELVSTISGGLFLFASLVYFITHLIYIHFAVESYRKHLVR